jgi:hypothetical protein
MCDAREIGIEYDTGIAVAEQVTTSFNLPITFDASDAHLNVLFDSQFNVDMILHGGRDTFLRRTTWDLLNRTYPTTQAAPFIGRNSIFSALSEMRFGDDRLAIGKMSSILGNANGTAILKNSGSVSLGNFLVTSRPDSFVASCVPNTIISEQDFEEGRGMVARMDYISVPNLEFQFADELISSRLVAAVPGGLLHHITFLMQRSGATTSETIRNEDRLVRVMDNCSSQLVQRLPPIRFRMYGQDGGYIDLLPTDYIHVDDTGHTCHLLLLNYDEVSSRSGYRQVVVFPLRIPSWNTMYSALDLQVCNTALASPLPSHGSFLNIVTRTVPVHVEPETGGNFFRRVLRTARCAFRALGCRSR